MNQEYTKLEPIEISDNPIEPGTDIGHVHLKTANIERVYNFYVGILGFNVMFRTESILFISAGNYHHQLGFNTWESKDGVAPSSNSTGLYHVAIRYPTRQALGNALKRLMKAGWPLQGVNDHGTHEALYLADPDGNGLELYWDRPESEWPMDEHGHVVMSGSQMDLDGLLKE